MREFKKRDVDLSCSLPYVINVDSESGGIILVGQGGNVLTRRELKELLPFINRVFNYYGDEAIDRYNETTGKYPRYHITDKPPITRQYKAGVIYVLKGQDIYYKIGKTVNLVGRKANFDVKLPFPTELIHTIQTDDHTGAETYIHKKFAEKRVNGEWFTLSDEDILWLKSLARLDRNEVENGLG